MATNISTRLYIFIMCFVIKIEFIEFILIFAVLKLGLVQKIVSFFITFVIIFLTARRYASAVSVVALRPCVHMSVRHKSVFYGNGLMDRTGFLLLILKCSLIMEFGYL